MVERSLSMREAPGSIPGFSNIYFVGESTQLIVFIDEKYVYIVLLFTPLCNIK